MIACSRYLVRVDLVRRLTSSCLNINKSAPTLQFPSSSSSSFILSCSFHRGVSPKFLGEAVEVIGRDMERNKRNKTSFMWRQVSSQASSSQHEIPPQDLIIDSESVQVVADDERDETSSQGEENHDGISSHFSTFQHQTEVIVGVDKDISFRSVGIDEVEESRGAEITLGGKAVTPIADTCSSLKHSRHIQVSSSLIRFVKGKEGATQKNVEVRWEFRSNFQHLEKRIP